MTREIEIGIAQLARPGEIESGDRCVIRTTGQHTLIGVIDGLGHGPEAARAAAAAAEVLEAFAPESASPLLQRCHERLRDTRGAAITLLLLDAVISELQWVGVGNIAAALLRTEPSGKRVCHELLVRGGMAGSLLPSTEASRLEISAGDVVVVATDGLSKGFIDGLGRGEPPQQLAERLLDKYWTAQDDALVVVARIQGQRG